MHKKKMTSLERILAVFHFQQPDRVPLFLNLTIIGARELDLPIKTYLSSVDHIVKGQMLMRDKYRNDMVTAFSYSAAEIEAWGGEVIFYEDGPPNSGEPFIKKWQDIDRLSVPDIKNTPGLQRTLAAISRLKESVQGETPIIGEVTSPFSLPVMQMGFEKYLELLYENKAYFDKLMKINEEFCVAWANAQIAAGAAAIVVADPLASPTIIERATYRKTGFEVSRRTLARINGITATNLASGIAAPVLNDLVETGTQAVLVSAKDDLAKVKRMAHRKLVILGNLNGIEMRDWDRAAVQAHVKTALEAGAPGGGYILSDNHGEIPWQVPEKVLLDISETIEELGYYPTERTEENE